ncbi:hypothetical protein FRB90_011035, partial [Tulasnella sp. 427]
MARSINAPCRASPRVLCHGLEKDDGLRQASPSTRKVESEGSSAWDAGVAELGKELDEARHLVEILEQVKGEEVNAIRSHSPFPQLPTQAQLRAERPLSSPLLTDREGSPKRLYPPSVDRAESVQHTAFQITTITSVSSDVRELRSKYPHRVPADSLGDDAQARRGADLSPVTGS